MRSQLGLRLMKRLAVTLGEPETIIEGLID